MHTLRKPALFWDTDVKTLDEERHVSYIIERVLDFGDDEDIRWLFSRYPKAVIRETLRRPRNALHEKSKALWTLVLG